MSCYVQCGVRCRSNGSRCLCVFAGFTVSLDFPKTSFKCSGGKRSRDCSTCSANLTKHRERFALLFLKSNPVILKVGLSPAIIQRLKPKSYFVGSGRNIHLDSVFLSELYNSRTIAVNTIL